MQCMPKPKIIAHRGASSMAPENTMASFRKAMDIGVDMVEIDVHLTQDDHLVVLHDSTLERTTNGNGPVSEINFEDLRKLDAGTWFDASFENERVPAIQEVFDLIGGKCGLLLEIKVAKSSRPGLAKAALKAIDEANAQGWAVVQSFDDEILFEINEINPSIVTHKLIVEKPPIFPGVIDTSGINFGTLAKYKNQKAINCNHRFLGKKLIRKFHNHGFATFAWTVNEVEKGKKLMEWGVDGLITNYPQRFLK